MAKTADDNAVLGEKGVALISSMVTAMGHLWHPTTGLDSGIDGQIELRDAATREVRNVRIAVQSKATDRRWSGETNTEFYYRPRPKDIEYWLSSNQPVLLICSRPSSGEIYWRSIQEWAHDLDARKSGRVGFEKERDRFDADVREALFELGASAGDLRAARRSFGAGDAPYEPHANPLEVGPAVFGCGTGPEPSPAC